MTESSILKISNLRSSGCDSTKAGRISFFSSFFYIYIFFLYLLTKPINPDENQWAEGLVGENEGEKEMNSFLIGAGRGSDTYRCWWLSIDWSSSGSASGRWVTSGRSAATAELDVSISGRRLCHRVAVGSTDFYSIRFYWICLHPGYLWTSLLFCSAWRRVGLFFFLSPM